MIIEIGKPFTPSTIVSKKVIDATMISISCGGGVGGSYWKEYTTNTFDLNNNFINVNTNISENENINTRNIVKTQPIKIAVVKVKNEGNRGMGEVGETKTYYYVVSAYDTVKFTDSFVSKTPDSINVKNEDFIK